MWRFALLGVFVVGSFIGLIAIAEIFSGQPTPSAIVALPTSIPPPIVAPIIPSLPASEPLPELPKPLPEAPKQQPEPLPMATSVPILPPVAAIPSKPPERPPAPRARPRPTIPVIAPEPAVSVRDDVLEARRSLISGQMSAARTMLTRVQTRMVLQPVTPDQPDRQDVNMMATMLGTAIKALDTGDTTTAVSMVNQLLSGPLD